MGRGQPPDDAISISRRRGASAEVESIEVRGSFDRIFRLRPGVLDQQAIEAFNGGQCHALALAIHEATNWPIIACQAAEWEDDPAAGEDELEVYHFAVQLPDGRLLDARGAYEVNDFLEREDLSFLSRPGFLG